MLLLQERDKSHLAEEIHYATAHVATIHMNNSKHLSSEPEVIISDNEQASDFDTNTSKDQCTLISYSLESMFYSFCTCTCTVHVAIYM